MLKTAHESATKLAIQEWTRRGHRDDFAGNFQDLGGNEVSVHIYHHETFPLGGQAFTIDVRPERDSQEILERSRVSLVDGRVSRT